MNDPFNRPVEQLGPAQLAPPRPLAGLVRVLHGGRGPARAALGYVGLAAAVTVGNLLGGLITHC